MTVLRFEPVAHQPVEWELRLDGTRCDAHGICALLCPELVTLDRWGFAGVRSGPIVGRTLLRQARRAVSACPEQALALVPRSTAPATGAAQ